MTYQFNNRFRALILAGIILRLVILLLPFDVIFSRWGSDDLYYYSQIAGRFSEIHFFTFDGIAPTNGFQPFFMFLLIPFGGAMLNDVQSSLRIILGIVSILTIVTAFQIPKLFKDYGLNSQLALIASGLFLLHPKILSVTFNGTEAALSFLMIILSLRALQWIKEGKRLFLSTLIFSGLILTRMDFSILLFLLFITGLVQRHSLIDWIKVLVLPTILFGTWLAINYYYFDCIIPSSGVSKSRLTTVLDINYFRLWLSTYSTAMMSESKLSITVFALCALGSLYAFKQKAFQYKRYVFYMFGLSAICGLIPILSIGYFRDWYLILHFILILFLGSLGIYFVLQKTKYKIAIYLLIIVGLWTEAQYTQRKFNGSQIVEACLQFERKIPKEVKVGSFNAGIVNCVIDNHTVINLDGVVNSTILEYFVDKNIQSYFERYDIRYIIDNKSSIEYFLNNYSDQQKWVIVDQFSTDTQEWVLVSLP